MKTILEIADKKLKLERFPKLPQETLQAWDAGDEFIINHLCEENLAPGKNILILNDNFGALSAWFSFDHQVWMQTDSFISHKASLKNLQRNQCPKINLLTSLEDIPQDIDLVLMQLPKSNRMLCHQLTCLRHSLPKGTPLIAVNKAKDIHSSTLKLVEEYFGKPKTSLAVKKHRLVFANSAEPEASFKDQATETKWSVDDYNMQLTNLANVYSGEKLDLGGRFMLEQIPSDPSVQEIIDLGCGNGVLSIHAARQNPQANLTCVDESFMAVESAKQNLHQNLNKTHSKEKLAQFQFIANNALDGFAKQSADLILCNPPFHQGNTITDHIAWQMFSDAKKCLKDNGKLLVVGNKHLKYDQKLKRLFGKQVSLIAQNNKFVIFEAIKTYN